jgi:hypothetical protein
MRVVRNKEGDGGGGKSNVYKGVVQQKGQWRWRQEQWRRGWWASNGNGNDMGNGDGNKAGRQQRGQVQGRQGQWQQQ